MTAPTPDTDVAYAAGAEAMREACAHVIRNFGSTGWYMPPGTQIALASTVARLPLPPAPTDGAW